MEGVRPDEYALPTQLWMIRDTVRAEVYRAALRAVITSESVVVDVGAGTGLLSLLAAQAGAARVYALERQAVADTAKRLVAASPWADRITVLQTDAETFELRDKADVLVSEWMGFYAIEENLVPVVAHVRDHACKPGAAILPETFTVYACPIEDPVRLADWAFWQGRPFDLDLKMLYDTAEVGAEFGRDNITPGMLLADPQPLFSGDLRTIAEADAAEPWRSKVRFSAARDGNCTGIALWFATQFPGGVELRTSPADPATHWGVSVLPVREPRQVEPGTPVTASVACVPTIPGHASTYWGVRVDDHPWERHGGGEGGEAWFDYAPGPDDSE